MAIIKELFKVIPPLELDVENPRLHSPECVLLKTYNKVIDFKRHY